MSCSSVSRSANAAQAWDRRPRRASLASPSRTPPTTARTTRWPQLASSGRAMYFVARTQGAYARPVAVRVVLAEDSLLVREGVQRLLDLQPGVEVSATCADLDSLLQAVETEQPDVVLTDIRMPPDHHDEGIQAAARFRDTNPELGVVVLSQYAEPAYALAL